MKIKTLTYMDCTIELINKSTGDIIQALECNPILRKDFDSQAAWEQACLEKAINGFQSQFLDELKMSDWTYRNIVIYQEDFCVRFGDIKHYLPMYLLENELMKEIRFDNTDAPFSPLILIK